eukprot:CFRG6166T1
MSGNNDLSSTHSKSLKTESLQNVSLKKTKNTDSMMEGERRIRKNRTTEHVVDGIDIAFDPSGGMWSSNADGGDRNADCVSVETVHDAHDIPLIGMAWEDLNLSITVGGGLFKKNQTKEKRFCTTFLVMLSLEKIMIRYGSKKGHKADEYYYPRETIFKDKVTTADAKLDKREIRTYQKTWGFELYILCKPSMIITVFFGKIKDATATMTLATSLLLKTCSVSSSFDRQHLLRVRFWGSLCVSA